MRVGHLFHRHKEKSQDSAVLRSCVPVPQTLAFPRLPAPTTPRHAKPKKCCAPRSPLLSQSSQEATFHINHVVPRNEGGKAVAANLALACVTCSLLRSLSAWPLRMDSSSNEPLPTQDNAGHQCRLFRRRTCRDNECEPGVVMKIAGRLNHSDANSSPPGW